MNKILGIKIQFLYIFLLIFLLFLVFWFLYNSKIKEGLSTDVIFKQINTVLDDTSHNDFIKTKAIMGLVYMMDDENDQTKFNNVLNNDVLDSSQKIEGVKRTIREIQERIETERKNREEKEKTMNAKKQSDEASKNSPMHRDE